MRALSCDAGPLAGLRVVDLSQGVAGPSCAGILARDGADVIKIEPPHGDWARLMGGGRDGQTALSVVSNLGKRSMSVNAMQAEGREVIRRLAAGADVLVESFRPGVMRRLGLEYDTLRADNAELIYASITGFGATGPYQNKPGADSVIQALTGMMVMNQDAQGRPRRVGMVLVDVAAGVYAAHRIATALFARQHGAGGCHLDISLMAVAASLQSIPIVDDRLAGDDPRLPVTVPSGTFDTADGQINVTALRNDMFFGLCRAIGRPEWQSLARYATNELRLAHAAEINAGIAEALRAGSTAEWLARLEAHDVLCAPVNDYRDFLADPHVDHAAIFGRCEQPELGSLPIARLPGSREDKVLPPAPANGADTTDVLVELGYAQAEIDAMLRAGVVQTAARPATTLAQTERSNG